MHSRTVLLGNYAPFVSRLRRRDTADALVNYVIGNPRDEPLNAGHRKRVLIGSREIHIRHVRDTLAGPVR